MSAVHPLSLPFGHSSRLSVHSTIPTTSQSPRLLTLNFLNLTVGGSHDHHPLYLTKCGSPTVHKDDISREQLKELLYEEIMSFNPPPMT